MHLRSRKMRGENLNPKRNIDRNVNRRQQHNTAKPTGRPITVCHKTRPGVLWGKHRLDILNLPVLLSHNIFLKRDHYFLSAAIQTKVDKQKLETVTFQSRSYWIHV